MYRGTSIVRGLSLFAAGIVSLAVSGCAGEDRDRIHLDEPPGKPPAEVALTPLTLDGDKAFDGLDEWLKLSGDVEDVVRVYDDLARLAPESTRIQARGALAVMSLDAERGRSIAKGVLKRFEDRRDDPVLQDLARRAGIGRTTTGQGAAATE